MRDQLAGRGELFADRFLVVGEQAIDLADGEEVFLVRAAAGTEAEQVAWNVRCDFFLKLRAPALAPLVDYGLDGRTERFEAWRCGPARRGTPGVLETAIGSASTLLRAMGATGLGETPIVRTLRERAVIVPDERCGREEPPPAVRLAARDRLTLEQCAIQRVTRGAVDAVVEAIDEAGGKRPVAIGLWGPVDAGLRTAALEIARAVRLHGFIPLGLMPGGAGLLTSSIDTLARGERSVCLIAHVGAAGWRGLLDHVLRAPRPHVLLLLGRSEVPMVPSAGLQPLRPDQLIEAVLPKPDAATARVLADAARRAGGLPGRFARYLWRLPADSPLQHASGLSIRPARRAAETLETLQTGRTVATGTNGNLRSIPASPWPLPGELSALRRRVQSGMRLLDRGRHAPAVRTLRHAIGGLVRRADWLHVVEGETALAAHLRDRGQMREADGIARDLDAHAAAIADDHHTLRARAAIVSATIAFECGRLDAASNMLHAIVLSADAHQDASVAAVGRLAMSRVLFWRGRYDEADHLLGALRSPPDSPEMVVKLASARARIAMARGDAGGAIAEVTRARQASERAPVPALAACAAGAAAFVHLILGDAAALDADVRHAIAAARRAHDPLRALKARLAAAEGARRAGSSTRAEALLRHLRAVGVQRLPLTVRARADVLAGLLAGTTASDEVVRRQAASTGLHALGLLASHRPRAAGVGEKGNERSSEGWSERTAEETVELLRGCECAGDDRQVLIFLCAALKQRLACAGIAIFTAEGALLADAGRRVEAAIAARALAARQAIPSHDAGRGLEMAMPIAYAGANLAAFGVRWPLGGGRDAAGAARLLRVAAAIAGPAAAALASRQPEQRRQALDGIVGGSDTIAEVQRAIDRAAPTPFAVLIVGESGSGKELVARALHRRGPRRNRPFCAVNCAALPDDLVESELFGHARGAFTGAAGERPGVFEEAHTGTLFLDEVGELSPRAQAKMLRTIQEGEVRRVGENVGRRIDVRIVAATNRDLAAEASAGRFRQDLLYRLDVVRITVPPLRERRDDVPLLVDRLWQDATARVASRAVLSTATIAALARYDWPGNVRELQNVLASLAVRGPRRGSVGPDALPSIFGGPAMAEACSLESARRTFEERFVRAALVRAGGRRTQAAADLGVTRQGLSKLLNRLGIAG